ncbi:MAG: hypothetical protein IT159_10560 [Bryobacterales bacterium]|nr:hypothetical protein [Bryobacterales bacterium]
MRLSGWVCALLATGGLALAQPEPAPRALASPQAAADGAAGGRISIEYVAVELRGGIVKDAPYSADSLTETTQTLADGSRIVRKSTATVYRDSQGRMRREQTLGAAGPPSAQPGEPLRLVTISDPVAGVSYTLDPRTRTATRLPSAVVVEHLALPPDAQWIRQEAPEEVFDTAVPSPSGKPAKRVVRTTVVRHAGDAGQAEGERLGKQVMEGVEVEGTRQVTPVPAGQTGNGEQVKVAFERWYSPRLQTVVLSRRSDPHAGDTVYRLTNINLSEPPASLFQVPAGYAVKEGPQAEDALFIGK